MTSWWNVLKCWRSGEQCIPWCKSSLICIYTVCSGMSVQVVRLLLYFGFFIEIAIIKWELSKKGEICDTVIFISKLTIFLEPKLWLHTFYYRNVNKHFDDVHHNLPRITQAYILCIKKGNKIWLEAKNCRNYCVQCTLYSAIDNHRGLVKEEYLVIILGSFFLFLHKNIYCGYSLEVPCWGTSNEYPQHMCLWTNHENYPRIIIKILLNKSSEIST